MRLTILSSRNMRLLLLFRRSTDLSEPHMGKELPSESGNGTASSFIESSSVIHFSPGGSRASPQLTRA